MGNYSIVDGEKRLFQDRENPGESILAGVCEKGYRMLELGPFWK